MLTLYLILVVVILGLTCACKYKCPKCGSFSSEIKTLESGSWGECVGGILFSDPYVLVKEVRICRCCQNQRVLSQTTRSATDADDHLFDQQPESHQP